MDWEAKCALIQTAKVMGIQRYIFFSIDKCDKHSEVPLMNLKFCVEKYLAASGLNYTVLRLTGFMQPLISAYAVPILEARPLIATSLLAPLARACARLTVCDPRSAFARPAIFPCASQPHRPACNLAGAIRLGHQRQHPHRVPRHSGCRPHDSGRHQERRDDRADPHPRGAARNHAVARSSMRCSTPAALWASLRR